ncbi:MFS transporter [Piscinibacter gummiphilus]|jgi:MFS family permease|uniref:MFS transporter n=1 Tax=Piscinibacter gummiphilus TaxID=946333 RepID=A0ABZ0D2A9_9BURK|nr:MFS transporter [Piscinibacter gummiphilus]WOB10911.1 MFS transporter [Piscinibacter gummiphilus]
MTNPPRIERQPTSLGLGAWQLAWLAAAVFVVSAGYGALMPLLPAWLAPLMAADGQAEVARHVGLLSGLYAAGVLVGAPLWGLVSDRWGRGRILVIGLVGYVTSLLPLLWPDWIGLAGIYASRGATGFFVAAVVPVVPALVAEHTPQDQRARRFAWLGAMSLLGFLFGPGLNAAAAQMSTTLASVGAGTFDPTNLVIVTSAALGALMMLGLATTLPRVAPAAVDDNIQPQSGDRRRTMALWGLNGAVMFVLSGFELGIVLQGQQHPTLSSREISLMFAECSLVMLGVNALLFFTGLLERAAGRGVMAAGLVLAIAGLAMLAQHRSDGWMYIGVSLTAAGTGLVLPTISYLAAGASRRRRLGATMGGLAAAAGFGQTLGSAAAGWLFGAVAQFSFAWLALPLLATLGTLIVRPAWWSTESQPPHSPRVSPAPLPK